MTTETERFDAVVVGGGMAGATALRDLCAAGHRATLLEARDRLGGRTWFFESDKIGKGIELGGAYVFPRGQHHVLDEMDRYGLERETTGRAHPNRYVWTMGGERRSGFPVRFDEAIVVEHLMHHIGAAARRIDFGHDLDDPSLTDLDVSVSDFLAPLGLPNALLDLAYAYAGTAMAGLPPEETSALQLLNWVAGTDNSAVSYFYTPRFRLVGGTASLIQAMLTDAAADVRLSTPVTAIEHGRDEVHVRTGEGVPIVASVAVLAIPLNCWKQVEIIDVGGGGLSSEKETASSEMNGSRGVKVHMLVEGVTDIVHAVGAGGAFQMVFTDDQLPTGRSVFTGFATAWSLDPTARAEVETGLRYFVPDARLVDYDFHDWNNDPYSSGTWMMPRPGYLGRFYSKIRQSEGRMVFAGADLGNGFNCWIDSAVESGKRAASEADAILRATAPVAR